MPGASTEAFNGIVAYIAPNNRKEAFQCWRILFWKRGSCKFEFSTAILGFTAASACAAKNKYTKFWSLPSKLEWCLSRLLLHDITWLLKYVTLFGNSAPGTRRACLTVSTNAIACSEEATSESY
jgi:hypothetical protein